MLRMPANVASPTLSLYMSETKDTSLWELVKQFFLWIGRCCKSFGSWFASQIKITFRKWYIVIPVTILFICLGYYFSRIENRKYKAEGMAIIHGSMAAEIKEAVRPLEMAMPAHVQPSQTLAARLNCPPEYTAGIRRFTSFLVVDYLGNVTPDAIDRDFKHDLADSVNVISNNYIVFQVYTKDLANLENFENALVNYVNSNPIIQEKYRRHHATMEYELQTCINQLNYLDSLSKVFYFNFPQGFQVDIKPYSSTLIMGKRSVDVIHDDVMDLIQYKKGVESELSSCTQPLVFISHLSAAPRAINNRILCLLLGCIIGWLFGIGLAWLIEDRKQVREWLNSK